jgi:hypothetical protein
MVGLGVPEIIALNDGARRHLFDAGRIGGESLDAWGRTYLAGERLVALANAGNGIRCGMAGTVLSVDTRAKSLTVEWPFGATTMNRSSLRRIGHGYAATPRLASRMLGPVFLLGNPEGLALERGSQRTFRWRDQGGL